MAMVRDNKLQNIHFNHGVVIMKIKDCRIAIADDEAMIRYGLKTLKGN